MRRFYVFTRDVHLYLGLFISPFILAFCVSVFFLVHAWIPGALQKGVARTAEGVPLPEDAYSLAGRDQVEALRPVLERLGVSGEVTVVRRVPKERSLVLEAVVPGRETTVDLSFEKRTAVISEHRTGTWGALIYLHKMPGPHNSNLRGNSLYMRFWRWLADGTVYAILLISATGLYLWTALRTERRIGLLLIAGGAFSFFGIVYALAQ